MNNTETKDKKEAGYKPIVVRLTPEEHKALRVRAAQEGTTITAIVRTLLNFSPEVGS